VARQILRDIDSLDSHTAFLFDKINKIFSVASVVLLPPTLIASIYGMNFKGYFPELEWAYGYPYALFIMVASALVPMWYFRKRSWLK
jgi:magnesium transporter